MDWVAIETFPNIKSNNFKGIPAIITSKFVFHKIEARKPTNSLVGGIAICLVKFK